ncbi:MAG: DNA helicase RecQ, partial [Phycisphaerales bacterium]
MPRIIETIRRYWGFDTLRPLQEEAIWAGLQQRDSLVVLPTGGGKSLCYQVPPVLAKRTDIVVSPLISLMKDQVDGLRACGYPAAALHSGMTSEARREAEREIASGQCRLVFVAPERLLTPGFLRTVERLKVRAFAVDEAHCISHWGHDFRPEYRQMATLKERFPQVGVQAYTATATARVRADIVEQLQLQDPAVLVGVFDRPNLVYRVVPRTDAHAQTLDVIRRHGGEAVIVYCLSRKDTEAMAGHLKRLGVKAEAYHAGMASDARRRIQDSFADESLDVVVATVAFGMGIDRSDVRCVVHATMPKSVEHYQQETGRAGRDGLEAECVLFYSAADVMRWEALIRRSAEEAEAPAEVIEAAVELLQRMRRFCSPAVCRHRALSEYFGQVYDRADCGACDVCLDEVEGMADATVTAQKILSCVARVQERFGAGHVTDVLLGADTERVQRWGHDRLSTYGLMKGTPRQSLRNIVYQLVDQGLLFRSDGDRPVLGLTDESWRVLRGERSVRLLEPKAKPVKKTRVDRESWAGVDQALFEHLRGVRRELARERGVPPYIVFGDASLRDMARRRPTSLD